MKGLADREEFEEFVDFVKRAAVDKFTSTGIVQPHALIIATQHPETGEAFADGAIAVPVLGDRFGGPNDYNLFFEGTRAAALQSKAVGVIFISEVWLAPFESAKGEASLPCLNETDLGGKRREAVLVSVDHVCYPRTIKWIAFIVRALGKPTLERWRRVPDDPRVVFRERFSEMFPRELWQ